MPEPRKRGAGQLRSHHGERRTTARRCGRASTGSAIDDGVPEAMTSRLQMPADAARLRLMLDRSKAAELAAVLDWYREMGAEEAVGETPDRLAAARRRGARQRVRVRCRRPQPARRRAGTRRAAEPAPSALGPSRAGPCATAAELPCLVFQPPYRPRGSSRRPRRTRPSWRRARPRGKRQTLDELGLRGLPPSTAAASRPRPRTCASIAGCRRRASC